MELPNEITIPTIEINNKQPPATIHNVENIEIPLLRKSYFPKNTFAIIPAATINTDVHYQHNYY